MSIAYFDSLLESTIESSAACHSDRGMGRFKGLIGLTDQSARMDGKEARLWAPSCYLPAEEKMMEMELAQPLGPTQNITNLLYTHSVFS